MDELVPIKQDEKFGVNARDLFNALKPNYEFANWMRKRIGQLGLDDATDFTTFLSKNKPGRGRPNNEYLISTNAAKHISMSERTPKGREVRDYFIEAEDRLRNIGIDQKPRNRMLALEEADSTLGISLSIADRLGIPTSRAQSISVIKVRAITGVDLSPYLLEAPAQNDIQENDVWLEPAELAKKFDYKSGAEINKVLALSGLQFKEGKQWIVDNEYKQYVERHQWTKKSKTGYNWKWNVEFVGQYL